MLRARKTIADQVVVVTGASSGIGLATARLAAARGARVVLIARNGDALAMIASGIEARGGRALAIEADVGDPAAIAAAVAKTQDVFGGFDTWVNVAGTTIYGRLWEVERADHERLMQTNFWGTVNGSLAAVEHLRRKGGGLINVGSILSNFAVPMQGMYVASKHAVKGFTDALRMELAQEHLPVTVTLIEPASVDSPLPSVARNYMTRQPSLPPPLYPPEEVAHAICAAIEYPQREIFVGGAGKALVTINKVAPAFFDLVAPVMTAFEKRRERPHDRAGGLNEAASRGEVRGDTPQFKRQRSYYTRMAVRPKSAASLVVGGAAFVAAALFGVGHRRPRRR